MHPRPTVNIRVSNCSLCWHQSILTGHQSNFAAWGIDMNSGPAKDGVRVESDPSPTPPRILCNYKDGKVRVGSAARCASRQIRLRRFAGLSGISPNGLTPQTLASGLTGHMTQPRISLVSTERAWWTLPQPRPLQVCSSDGEELSFRELHYELAPHLHRPS